jgi:hypothetical protein
VSRKFAVHPTAWNLTNFRNPLQNFPCLNLCVSWGCLKWLNMIKYIFRNVEWIFSISETFFASVIRNWYNEYVAIQCVCVGERERERFVHIGKSASSNIAVIPILKLATWYQYSHSPTFTHAPLVEAGRSASYKNKHNQESGGQITI